MNDIRDSLKILRNLDKNHLKRLNESENNNITPNELEEQIQKFNENVIFTPKEDFGRFIKNDSMVVWGGKCDGKIYWSFHVTESRDSSDCSIELKDPMKLTDENIQLLTKLKSYYDQFYEYWVQEL